MIDAHPQTRIRRLFVLGAALSFVLALSACGGDTPEDDDSDAGTAPASPATTAETSDDAEGVATEDAGDELVSLSFPATAYNVNTGYYPIAVAVAKGFFEDQGLDLEPIPTGGGGEAVRAFTSDSDSLLASVGLPSAIPAIDAGEEFKIFAQMSVASDTWIAVRSGEGIDEVADLEGTQIGVTRPGSTTEAVAIAALESVGLTPEDAELVYLGGVPDLVVALQEGLVDAISGAGWLTRTQYVEVEGVWSLLGTGDEFTPVVDAVFVAKQDVVENNPEIYEAFLAGRNAAVEHIANNPDDPELRTIMKDWLGITDDSQDEVVDVSVRRLSEEAMAIYGDGQPNIDTFEGVAATMVEQGAIAEVPSDWSVYVVD